MGEPETDKMTQVRGRFSTPEETSLVLKALKKAGLEEVSVYSPFDPEEVDIPLKKIKSPVAWFTAAGAMFGVMTGIVFTVGTSMLYPVETGGMPVLSLPAIAILSFDFMLLFAILFTIMGFIYCAIFKGRPSSGASDGSCINQFDIVVSGDGKTRTLAQKILKKAGPAKSDETSTQLCLAFFIILGFSLSLTTTVFAWPWSQDMVDQVPRKAQSAEVTLPTSTISRRYTSFESTQKSQAPGIPNPTEPNAASLARGKSLYDRFCTLCHGSEGKGDGIIAKKIGELPDFTEDAFRNQPDGCIYFAITNGANFRKAVFPLEVSPFDEMDDHHDGEESGHEHGHEDEHSHGDPMFTMDEQGHAHDDAPAHEDEHSHGDPMFTVDEGHGHDDAPSHEDEHSHGDSMFTMDEQGHAPDNGDGHAHSGENECNSGHVHAPGEGHGDDGHGDGGGMGHDDSKKKHFMPPHRDAILLIDRWHIVNYMKHELGQ